MTEAARLNSPSTIIKTKRDFSSVARQHGHLSLWPCSPWGRLGRPAHQPSLDPSQKAAEQSPRPSWSAGQQTQAFSQRRVSQLEAQAGQELVYL